MNRIETIRLNIENAHKKKFTDSQILSLCEHFTSQYDEEHLDSFTSTLMSNYSRLSYAFERGLPETGISFVNDDTFVSSTEDDSPISHLTTLTELASAAEIRSSYTSGHVKRIAAYCRLTAEKLIAHDTQKVLGDDFPSVMATASTFHDIGKMGISKSILSKTDKLSFGEIEIAKTHVVLGYNILASALEINPECKILKMGCDIALYHHEKWDGSGHISGLKEYKIPVSARIVALADAYDALRSKRPYKESYPHDIATEAIIAGKGTYFDPTLVEIFEEHNVEYKTIFDNTP